MNITCDIILDLIPLVKDNVASSDSRELVLEHIKTCEGCRLSFETDSDNYLLRTQEQLDDKRILASIKKSIYIMGIAFLILGSIIGFFISSSSGLPYNFILMPVIGCVGYMVLKNKWYFAPLGVFCVSYLWFFIKYAMENGFDGGIALSNPLFYSILFTVLVLIGAVIAKLLKYAFGKTY